MSESRYVITVTRQFGSLGRPIAKKLSELLEIGYYDRDLVDSAAKQLKLPASVVDEEEELAGNINPLGYLRNMQFPLGKNTNTQQDEIFETQQEIIRSLADKENCVIVGRCADFTLLDRENVINIFIYSPYRARVKNCIEELKLEEKEAKQLIVRVDAARNSYHMHYAGYYPDDKNYKDLMIDSSVLGVEGTAEYLAEFIRRKFGK